MPPQKKNFALIGAAGFVAPRHMKAIKESGGDLLVAIDKSDSVGILDSFFPDVAFFTEFERFDRHIDKIKRQADSAIDYVSICSPNYLHDAHCRFAMRSGANAICEKPLVLNPWNLDGLQFMEGETSTKVNTILQLRLHPSVIQLKENLKTQLKGKRVSVDLSYITARGAWYQNSWKGDVSKSGGIATNIGIHFFDMLIWLFGPVSRCVVNHIDSEMAAGILTLKDADIRWFLSTNRKYLPDNIEPGMQSFRSISIEQEEIEFSTGFKDLHTSSYEKILDGNGYGIDDARPSIELVHKIRESTPVGLVGDYHPSLKA